MTALKDADVEWVVNDDAELGVKIGEQFFFLYKGESLVYETGRHDDGRPMMWRHVGKREFGECCHPVNYDDPTKIGTVSVNDGRDWHPLPETEGDPMTDNIWRPHANAVEWIKAGGEVQTRDGEVVEVLSTNGKGKWPIVGYLPGRMGDDAEYPRIWLSSGAWTAGSNKLCDLIPVPRRHKGWVRIYRDAGDFCVGRTVYATEAEARDGFISQSNLLALKEITFTEGEGLE